jgi:hypothetical protein
MGAERDGSVGWAFELQKTTAFGFWIRRINGNGSSLISAT